MGVGCGARAVTEQARLLRRFLGVLAAWIAATSAANLLAPGSPRDLWFLAMVFATMVGPPAALAAAYRRSEAVRATVGRLDLGVVTVVQIARVAGIAMLALWAAHQLAAPFALWTGVLDVLIGLSALFVAYVATPARPLPRRALRAWHVAGLLDFAIAIPIAVLYSRTSLGVLAGSLSVTGMFEFPLSFIPMVGVPFTASMHVVALLRLNGTAEPVVGTLLAPASR